MTSMIADNEVSLPPTRAMRISSPSQATPVVNDEEEPAVVVVVPVSTSNAPQQECYDYTNTTSSSSVSSSRGEEYAYAVPVQPLQEQHQRDATNYHCDGICKAFVCMGILIVAGIAYIGVLLYQQQHQQPVELFPSATPPTIEELDAYFEHLLETLSPEVPALLDPTTAAFEGLEWMAFTDGAYGLLLDDVKAIRQRYALILLYFTTGGFDFWDKEWLIKGVSECDFEGVVCNNNNDDDGVDESNTVVTDLDLKSRSLVGPLPKQIAWLDQLQVLDLRLNRLSGSIPHELLVECTQLQVLELSFNRLIGHGPRDLSALSHLRRVNLRGNALTGTLPPTLPETLQFLILDNNDLSGTVPDAWFEGQGTSSMASGSFEMQILDLSGNNRINGTLGSGIGHWSHLRSISIGSTEVSGTIPSEIGNLATLEEISIVNSQLSGTLPQQFYNLTSLQWIVAGNNPLNGNLSSDIGKLTDLQVLQLSHTMISGTIPTEMGRLSKLEWLQISNTEISGTLPSELGQLSILSRLWIHNSNDLEGSIPDGICDPSRAQRVEIQIGCASSMECSCCNGCL